MKTIFKIFGCLILLIVIAVGAAIYYMDNIIREAVVRVVPEVTGTEVALDSVNVSLLNGSASLEGLLIGNPDGYSDPNAFSLGEIAVDLDLASLREDVILIHRIYITAPEVSYENLGEIDNFRQILANVNERLGGSDSEAVEEETQGQQKKIIIEQFVFKDGIVGVKHPLLPSAASVPLPDLELVDIGKKTNGTTAKEAAAQIFQQISDATVKAVTGSQLIEQARAKLEQFEAEARAKVDEKLNEIIDNNLDGKVQEQLESLGVETDADSLKELIKGF